MESTRPRVLAFRAARRPCHVGAEAATTPLACVTGPTEAW
jgi:hypothetical protein